ncbi:hypothetical protein [Acinetobacter rudis]|uniref:Uncharacterized protein n=1 Tax=Acinetobacter rudis CIP 110305 TaxID=421052 RepID=S3N7R6_9GAMM|nr:hypothetical protein [Acinetobacter rudis]EPF74443.1 hypothetical protein F945_01482 [Acinetobacter rudis CIP 110305]
MDHATQQQNIAHAQQTSGQQATAENNEELVEVWGDTVSLSALIKSILIGAIFSVSFFYASQLVLTKIVENQTLAHAYSMLCGLVGCLIAGFVCSILFKPKREILESENQSMEWFDLLIEQWEKEGKSIGELDELPEKIVQELKELNLYDAFLAHAQKHQHDEAK